jgi:hypothetical protein
MFRCCPAFDVPLLACIRYSVVTTKIPVNRSGHFCIIISQHV